MQEKYMKQAIELSRNHMQNGDGGPFGAVVVKDGIVIGQGWNKVTTACDPTAHAEVEAIREACRTLNVFDLHGAEIYTSCEPCPMCLSAIYWARIEHVYFANTRQDAAQIQFDDDFIYQEVAKKIPDRKIKMTQVLHQEAKEVFLEWDQKANKVRY